MKITLTGQESIDVPGTESLKTGVGYHYTSAQGLLGILQSNALWSTSALQLNDESEVIFALEVIAEALEARPGRVAAQIKEQIDESWASHLRAMTYVASVSREPDLLTQWVHYAGTTGYGIGLDFSERLVPAAPRQARGTQFLRFLDSVAQSGWWPVIYKRSEQVRAVTVMVEAIEKHASLNEPFYRDDARDPATHLIADTAFSFLTPQFKHPAFADEREIRHITTGAAGRRKLYRPGPYGLVPYLSLTRQDADDSDESPRPLPIVSLHIGPTPVAEREVARQVAKELLADHGFHDVDVQVSDIPYRHPRAARF